MPIQKANVPPVTREALDRQLLAMGRLKLDIRALEAEMNGETDAVKARYSERIEGLAAAYQAAGESLELAVGRSRDELLTGRKKSLDLVMGRVGFKAIRQRVALRKGLKAEEVIRTMEARALDYLIRLRKELNKPAIAEAVAENRVGADVLVSCGIEFRGGRDEFYWDFHWSSIEEALDRAGERE